MMGTYARVLGGKKIRTFQDRFKATVTGDIEAVDGVLKITQSNATYCLRHPPEKWEDAREALENYIHLCPGAQSVTGCIKLNHELKMEDSPD